jgi:hypothetical protein
MNKISEQENIVSFFATYTKDVKKKNKKWNDGIVTIEYLYKKVNHGLFASSLKFDPRFPFMNMMRKLKKLVESRKQYLQNH